MACKASKSTDAVAFDGSVVHKSADSIQLIVLYVAAPADNGAKADPRINAVDNKAEVFTTLFIIRSPFHLHFYYIH